MTTDFVAATERYLAFWNAGSPQEQRGHAPGAFTEDVQYRAPVGVLRGAEALIDFRTQLTENVGPVSFVAQRDPEGHNDRVRLLWEILLADGTSFAAGTDVLCLAEDGRIGEVSAFLDRAPEGFDHHDDA